MSEPEMIDYACNGLKQYAALHAPKLLTATELSKMIDGWPKGARPTMEFIEGAFARDGGGFAYTIHDEHAIDLACMSGLRWLVNRSGKASQFSVCAEAWYDKQSLLEQVDAAVRATATIPQ